jgi:hypothetical protein
MINVIKRNEWNIWRKKERLKIESSSFSQHSVHIVTCFATEDDVQIVFGLFNNLQVVATNTYNQGPDFDDIKISEKWSIKWPKNI